MISQAPLDQIQKRNILEVWGLVKLIGILTKLLCIKGGIKPFGMDLDSKKIIYTRKDSLFDG
jgi:hypothetical protein